ncbi:MAG: hypothetical protein KDA85_15050, partial [Planctomycetaceae bacterium]|nr:hypothetical protein [Planctomycetaceae bacterium]
DAELSTKAAAGGYLLEVTDFSGSGGAAWTYDLEVNQGNGRLELIVPADRLNVPAGGSASLGATLNRLGVAGPVTVSAVQLPYGLSMSPVVVHDKQRSVPLTLTATDANTPEALSGPIVLQLTGAAGANPVQVIRLAPPAVKKKDADPFRSFRFRSDLCGAIRPAAQFSLSTDTVSLTVKRGETATVNVKAVRSADWTMAIALSSVVPADQLPPGIGIAPVQLDGEQAAMAITTTAETATGQYTVFLQGTAKKDKEEATWPLPPVTIEITE